MLTRTLTVLCVAAALAVPVNAAQAGALTNLARLAKTGVKANAKLVKAQVRINLNVAKCGVKALTKTPCIL